MIKLKLKTKNLRISTGGIPVVLMHHKDAEKLDLHPIDRIKLKFKRKEKIAIIDIDASSCVVKEGEIGLFEEMSDSFKVKQNTPVELITVKKPHSVGLIRKKLDGHELTKGEIDLIVNDIVENNLSEIELTYFVSACYSNSLSMRETVFLTEAMVKQGEILNIDKYPVIDKHCIGGVAGNRTTMLIVPIVASAGLTIPKTSSRAITSPAGTADTMEVLCDVCIDIKKMKSIVEKINGCIVWGGALNLAPADDKIIKVERPLSIDAESQLLASILAKKLSVSSTHVLIDIPMGIGAKIEDKDTALKLKKHFEQISKKLGLMVRVILTDGSNPIGRGIGPALEARDVLWILKGDRRGPQDLKNKSIMMAGHLLEIGGKAEKGKGRLLAKKIIESGDAYRKFVQIINAQGRRHIDPSTIPIGRYFFDIRSDCDGVVQRISSSSISKIARVAGAPTQREAGLYLHKLAGDKVKKGEVLFTIYSGAEYKLQYAVEVYKHVGAYTIKEANGKRT